MFTSVRNVNIFHKGLQVVLKSIGTLLGCFQHCLCLHHLIFVLRMYCLCLCQTWMAEWLIGKFRYRAKKRFWHNYLLNKAMTHCMETVWIRLISHLLDFALEIYNCFDHAVHNLKTWTFFAYMPWTRLTKTWHLYQVIIYPDI